MTWIRIKGRKIFFFSLENKREVGEEWSQRGEWWWEQCPSHRCFIFHFKSMVHSFGWVPGEPFKTTQAGAYPRQNKSFLDFLKMSLLIVYEMVRNFKVNKVKQMSPNPFQRPLPIVEQQTQVNKTAKSPQRWSQVPSSFWAPLLRHTFRGLSGSGDVKAALWKEQGLGCPRWGIQLGRPLSGVSRDDVKSMQGNSPFPVVFRPDTHSGVILTMYYDILHILDQQQKHNMMKCSTKFVSFSTTHN